MAEKLTPGTVICGGQRVPVTRVIAHPPGSDRKGIPIVADMTAVELVTPLGSRFYGCERAWIGPDLRMHVTGFNPGFEEMNAWENAS